MSTLRTLIPLLALCAAACSTEPSCEELDISVLEADTSSGEPVFRWRGEVASLQVSNEEVEDLWSVRCNCMAEERRPDSNAGCDDTQRDYEFRHCLTGPVTYGETPDIETLLEPDHADATVYNLDPVPLVSGESYEARITSFCAQTRDPNSPRFLERIAEFVAP